MIYKMKHLHGNGSECRMMSLLHCYPKTLSCILLVQQFARSLVVGVLERDPFFPVLSHGESGINLESHFLYIIREIDTRFFRNST